LANGTACVDLAPPQVGKPSAGKSSLFNALTGGLLTGWKGV
jgi:Fe2+ transport system protein B